MALLDYFNACLLKYTGVVNAVAAFSTLAAVIVSLRLAKAASRPKLRVLSYLGRTLSESSHPGKLEQSTNADSVAVSIQNIGPLPITINRSSFSWSLKGHGIKFLVPPISPDLVYQNLVIQPADGKLIVLMNEITGLRDAILQQELFFARWRLCLEVHGTDGTIHFAHLSSGLRKKLTR